MITKCNKGSWIGSWKRKKKKKARYWNIWCWYAPRRLASLGISQPHCLRNNPEKRTTSSVVYWVGDLTHLKQKCWGNTPPCTADHRQDTAAVFATLGRRRLPFIRRVDIRLAHKLPGKPVTGAVGKHVGSNWLNPLIWRVGESCEWAETDGAGATQRTKPPYWITWLYTWWNQNKTWRL